MVFCLIGHGKYTVSSVSEERFKHLSCATVEDGVKHFGSHMLLLHPQITGPSLIVDG
jgi:hypothetical protein